jgi:hypothetical protein
MLLLLSQLLLSRCVWAETKSRANSSPLLARVTVARGTGLSYDDAKWNRFNDLPLPFPSPLLVWTNLEQYLGCLVEEVKDSFVWWAKDRAVYPRLSQVAKDYSSIPGMCLFIIIKSHWHKLLPDLTALTATSVDVERVFGKRKTRFISCPEWPPNSVHACVAVSLSRIRHCPRHRIHSRTCCLSSVPLALFLAHLPLPRGCHVVVGFLGTSPDNNERRMGATFNVSDTVMSLPAS